ncbi:AEC family transporter [Patescibacteria group bacterium]
MAEVIINSLPVFVAILLGKLFSYKKIILKEAANTIGTITFKLIGPFFIFNVIYNISLNTQKSFLFYSSIIMIAVVLISTYLSGKYIFKLKKARLGALILCLTSFGAGAVYPFVGLNFSESTFKDFVIVDMLSFFVYLLLASFIASYFGKNTKKAGSIFKSNLKDPFILTMLITVLINLLNVPVPKVFIQTSEFFSQSFFLMASLFVGLTLKLPNSKQILKLSQFYIFRLVIVIITVMLISITLPLSKEQTYPLYLTFFAQYTVLAVIFSKEQDLDHEFASQLVLFSMVAQLFLYPIAIILLKA